MAVQSEVEEVHKNCTMQHDVLAKSINLAFERLNEEVLTKIHKRWIKVFKIIVMKGGENDHVEKFYSDTSTVIDLTDDKNHSSTHIEAVIDQCESTDEEMEEVDDNVQGDMDDVMVEDD